MSNVLKLGKKIFTAGVAFTTILWSVIGSAFFVLLPTAASAAECPTLVAGQMIKVTGKPAWAKLYKDELTTFSLHERS